MQHSIPGQQLLSNSADATDFSSLAHSQDGQDQRDIRESGDCHRQVLVDFDINCGQSGLVDCNLCPHAGLHLVCIGPICLEQRSGELAGLGRNHES